MQPGWGVQNPDHLIGSEALALLEIRNLTKQFGGLVVLDRLDMDVREGEILGIIGPNGPGRQHSSAWLPVFLSRRKAKYYSKKKT